MQPHVQSSPPLIQRRHLLGAAVAGLSQCSLPFANAATTSYAPFPLGIASGSPTADGFVLWTRVHPDLDEAACGVVVEWEAWPESADPTEAAWMHGTSIARSEMGYSVHVIVQGLPSDCWYRYRFWVGPHSSELGRARTLPMEGQKLEELTICVASCQRWEDGHYAAYRHMAQEQPDFLLFLGDYIYEYAGRKTGVRTHTEPHIRDLAGYRQRYALYKSDPALRAMHAQCTWIITPDDHDVEDNYIGVRSEKNTPDFLERKRMALQAFYENMPVRLSDNQALGLLRDSGSLPVHQRYCMGQLAALHVLDTRQFRTWAVSEPRVDNSTTRSADAVSTMLGEAQERWLADGLRSARRANRGWNLIAMQSRFTPGNYSAGRGHRFGRDTWDAFPSSRERVLASVAASGAKGVVFLGGDIHQFWVANVHRDPYDVQSDVVGVEFCGTSISSAAALDEQASRRSQQNNPHCILVDPSRRGYLLLKISAQRLRASLRQVSNVADPESSLLTLAHFDVLQDGRHVQLRRLDMGGQ